MVVKVREVVTATRSGCFLKVEPSGLVDRLDGWRERRGLWRKLNEIIYAEGFPQVGSP